MLARKKAIWISAAVGLLAALVVLNLWPGPKEPEYQGHKLSYWAEAGYTLQYTPSTGGFHRYNNKDANAINRDAINTIGTNGIPFYFEWLEYQESPIKYKCYNMWNQLRIRLGLDPVYDAKFIRYHATLWAIYNMRANPDAVVLGLAQILMAAKSPDSALDVAYVLAQKREPGLLPLVSGATNKNAIVRAAVAEAMSMIGTSNFNVFPEFSNLLQDPDPIVRKAADRSINSLYPNRYLEVTKDLLQGILWD